MTNIQGPGEEYFKNWMTDNQWVKKIPFGQIRYVPVKSKEKMMLFCCRCPTGVFGIAPMEYDKKFMQISRSPHNWTNVNLGF